MLIVAVVGLVTLFSACFQVDVQSHDDEYLEYEAIDETEYEAELHPEDDPEPKGEVEPVGEVEPLGEVEPIDEL